MNAFESVKAELQIYVNNITKECTQISLSLQAILCQQKAAGSSQERAEIWQIDSYIASYMLITPE